MVRSGPGRSKLGCGCQFVPVRSVWSGPVRPCHVLCVSFMSVYVLLGTVWFVFGSNVLSVNHLPYHTWLQTRDQTSRGNRKPVGNSWVVIPYHSSLLACGFSRVLNDCGDLGEFLGLGSFVPRVAWSGMHGNIAEIMASHFYTVVG